MGHSILSPSGAHRWMRCRGSAFLEKDIPDRSSSYADEGSAAHLIASNCQKSKGKEKPEDYLGRMLDMGEHSVPVTQEMVESVEQYMALVEEYAKGGGQIVTDVRVDFSASINQPEGSGTVDNGIIFPDRLINIDLKYGMGVKVDAEDNEQLSLYALGMRDTYEMMTDPTDFVMVIHQPRLGHISEHCVSADELGAFAEKAEIAAIDAMAMYNGEKPPEYNPGEKQCRFCKAKAICPALKQEMVEAVGHVASKDDFADLVEVEDSWLSVAMERVPLVEHWCLAIRAEVERRLFQGKTVEGFKLVEGRRGNRAWKDEQEAEKAMKAMRLKADEMYTQKLASPTTMEKTLKKQPSKWEKLQKLIVRADGKPSVAPAADKRPALAITSIADDFRDLIANSEEE